MGSFIILVIGLLLVFIEFFLPGGVMGTAGGILVIGSVVIFAMGDHSAMETLLFMTTAIVGLVGVIKFSIARIRKADPKSGLYSVDDQEVF
jgi:membrane-bound serine protease (ClpP class)